MVEPHLNIPLLSTTLTCFPPCVREDTKKLLLQYAPASVTVLCDVREDTPHEVGLTVLHPDAWACQKTEGNRQDLIIFVLCLHDDREKAESWLYEGLLAGKRVLILDYSAPARNLDAAGWLINSLFLAIKGQTRNFWQFSKSGGVERLIYGCDLRLAATKKKSPCTRLFCQGYQLNRFTMDMISLEEADTPHI